MYYWKFVCFETTPDSLNVHKNVTVDTLYIFWQNNVQVHNKLLDIDGPIGVLSSYANTFLSKGALSTKLWEITNERKWVNDDESYYNGYVALHALITCLF